MAQVINSNIASLFSQRNLNLTNSGLNTALQRLSSGKRINSAKDDAAGIAIASRFTAQIRGTNQGERNSADAISYAQTAEGALDEISSNMQRIRELAVQSANATNSATDRQALQAEVDKLTQEISRIVESTKFNGIKVLNSTDDLTFQVGANSNENNQISVSAIDLTGAAVVVAGPTQAEYDAALGVANAILNHPGTLNASPGDDAIYAGAGRLGALDANIVGSLEDLALSLGMVYGVDWDVSPTGWGTVSVNQISAQFSASEPIQAAVAVLEAASAGSAGAPNGHLDDTLIINAAVAKVDDFQPLASSTAGLYSYASDPTAVETISISSASAATTAISNMDDDLALINTHRATFGAVQNRFESVIRNSENLAENLSASRSRIEDADFAIETANLTKFQILQQAGTSVLSQANALPQTVLSLLA